jgi:hypothetical protein
MAWSEGSMRLGAFLPADRNMFFPFKKLDNGQSPNKEECQLTLVMPWRFGDAVLIWNLHLQSGLALHTQIWDDLTYLSTKFKENASSCSQVNMLICFCSWLFSFYNCQIPFILTVCKSLVCWHCAILCADKQAWLCHLQEHGILMFCWPCFSVYLS